MVTDQAAHDEQAVLRDVEQLQGQLQRVLDAFVNEQLQAGRHRSARFVAAHATTELLGALLAELVQVDPERGPTWCARTLDRFAAFLETSAPSAATRH